MSLCEAGNTGDSDAFSKGFGEKWVELLKEAVPEASPVAFLQFQADAVIR
jgi:hypothetical protein